MQSALTDHDGLHGLPLIRARHAFVPSALWRPALIASAKRASPTFPDGPIGTAWRYEGFVPVINRSGDAWCNWERQEANYLVRAEAEMQATFYAISLELGRRLLAGELKGFGQKGDAFGPWKEIPSGLWRSLRVEHSNDFAGWRNGRLVGGETVIWSVHIMDTVGLPMHAAALAYGPAEHAHVVQRAEAFGVREAIVSNDPTAPPQSAFYRKMADREARNPRLGPSLEPVPAAAHDESLKAINKALVAALTAGELVADRASAASERRTISPNEWRNSEFAAAAFASGDEWELRIRMRAALCASTAAEHAAPITAPGAVFQEAVTRQPRDATSAWPAWLAERQARGEDAPTSRQAEAWATEGNYSTGQVRAFCKALKARRVGRPCKTD